MNPRRLNPGPLAAGVKEDSKNDSINQSNFLFTEEKE